MYAQPDRAIEALARKQHGAFHRRQALELGLSARMIDGRRQSGAWLTLARGVYALNSHPFDWHRQAKAAELTVAGSVVSHGSAAVIHGFEGCRPGRIELSAPAAGRHDSPLATVHRRSKVEGRVIDGISVTPVARTLVDLAGDLTSFRLGRLVDAAVLDRATSVDELAAVVGDLARGARGAGRLRRVLARRDHGYVPSRSELEAGLDEVLRDPRLPASAREVGFAWWAGQPMRVDAVIWEWRRIIEVDGRRWHARVADFERDRARDHLAQRHGLEVTRFTYDQVMRQTGYAVETLLAIGSAWRYPPIGELTANSGG